MEKASHAPIQGKAVAQNRINQGHFTGLNACGIIPPSRIIKPVRIWKSDNPKMKTIVNCDWAAVLACSLMLFSFCVRGQSTTNTNSQTNASIAVPPVGASNTIPTPNTGTAPVIVGGSASMPLVGVTQANTKTLPVSVINDPNEMILKYQEFLRRETKEQRELFEAYYKRLAGVVAAVVFIFGVFAAFFGAKTYKDMKVLVLERVEEEVQKTVGSAVEERKKWMENQHRTGRLKVYREFKSVFRSLFEANPGILKQRVPNEVSAPAFKGKKILWVDDDPVGIVCQVAVLESLETRVDLVPTTEDALNQLGRDGYHLVISNMNRYPDPAAGVDLTRKIRATSQIPILIFTTPPRLESYGKKATEAGASALESETDKLLVAIYILIAQPKIITT